MSGMEEEEEEEEELQPSVALRLLTLGLWMEEEEEKRNFPTEPKGKEVGVDRWVLFFPRCVFSPSSSAVGGRAEGKGEKSETKRERERE